MRMEVLSSEIIYKMHPMGEVLVSIGVGMFLVGISFLLFFLITESNRQMLAGIILMFLGFITTSTSLIVGKNYWQIKDYTKQEVIFREDIPIEFFNDYEILEQRGEIFVIKEKEN
jgi:hypothetical protein